MPPSGTPVGIFDGSSASMLRPLPKAPRAFPPTNEVRPVSIPLPKSPVSINLPKPDPNAPAPTAPRPPIKGIDDKAPAPPKAEPANPNNNGRTI